MKKLLAIAALITMFTYADAQVDLDKWKVEKVASLEKSIDKQEAKLDKQGETLENTAEALEIITQRQGQTADNIIAIKAALKALANGNDTTVTIDGEQIQLFMKDVEATLDVPKQVIKDVQDKNPQGAMGYLLAILAVLAKLIGTGVFTVWITQVTKVYHKLRGWATGKPRSAVVALAASFVLALIYHIFLLKDTPFDFIDYGKTSTLLFTATIALYEGVLRHLKWFKKDETPTAAAQ